MEMSRHTFVKTEDYHIEWEIIGDHCHVHCEVSTWSKKVLREGYIRFVELRKFVNQKGYKEMVSISPNPKFCELFGARSIGTFKEGYEVMVWETAPI